MPSITVECLGERGVRARGPQYVNSTKWRRDLKTGQFEYLKERMNDCQDWVIYGMSVWVGTDEDLCLVSKGKE